jgi:hypothetical protein
MKATGELSIQAVTIEYSDLKHLVESIHDYLKDKKYKQVCSTVVFFGDKYKEEYQYDNFPEFQNFKEGLRNIDINISASDKLEINISLSSNEINPLGSIFSKATVETDDRIITNGLLDEIGSFFKKRRNFHSIFHTFGIYISIFISYLIYIIFTTYFTDFISSLNFKREYLLVLFLLLSFPIKKYLRWLFPYVYFVGENKSRTAHMTFFYIIGTGLLVNLIFFIAQGKIKSIIGL